MVALAQVLQQYAKLLGAPTGILCAVIMDLSRCLKPLLEKDDLMDVSMLEVAEEKPVASPTLMEEARLLG